MSTEGRRRLGAAAGGVVQVEPEWSPYPGNSSRAISADTVTDWQLSTLLDDDDVSVTHAAAVAMFVEGEAGREARALCAEILNARRAA